MSKIVTKDEVKQIQLELLRTFHDYCSSHGLRYSLSGGSLLGAVRHEGFIPWDDDIDVMMPRTDYETFLKEFEKASTHITILHYLKDSNYHLPQAKISDKRTYRKGFEAVGVNIDLFPIDGLPSDNMFSTWKKELDRLNDLRYKVFYYNYPQYAPKNYHSRIVLTARNIYAWARHFFLPNWIDITRQYNDKLSEYSFDKSNKAAVVIGKYGKRELLPQSVFAKYVPLLFEEEKYMCIEGYDQYLSSLYGDYMKLPPKDKRVASHGHDFYWK